MSQPSPVTPSTLGELVTLYLAHAQVYYRRRDGRPTGEHRNLCSTINSFVRHVGAGREMVSLTREDLKAWRKSLIERNLSRSYINSAVGRVLRWVRWCVEEHNLDARVIPELECVSPLSAFRSGARETKPREPANLEQVRRCLKSLSQPYADIVKLLSLTGARLGEILEATSGDVVIDRLGARLEPSQHKTAHLGRRRLIPLCDDAMAIVERYWRPLCPDDPLFPAVGHGSMRISRSPDCVRAAIRRACHRVGCPAWTPHQIRHAVAAIVRERRGLDQASALLGHAKVDTTQIYAPLRFERALEAMQAVEAVVARQSGEAGAA